MEEEEHDYMNEWSIETRIEMKGIPKLVKRLMEHLEE